MLYTFEFDEPTLDRVTDYLDSLYLQGSSQHVMGVQHRLHDDLVFVVIECTPESATYIHLLC
jgi:arginine decarboxylase-like protein